MSPLAISPREVRSVTPDTNGKNPTFQVLNDTFPNHTFLMNGLIVGIKGLLSFLSAPLIGALSDTLGRKFFLLITVAFTCAPIPLMIINTWWVIPQCIFGCSISAIPRLYDPERGRLETWRYPAEEI